MSSTRVAVFDAEAAHFIHDRRATENFQMRPDALLRAADREVRGSGSHLIRNPIAGASQILSLRLNSECGASNLKRRAIEVKRYTLFLQSPCGFVSAESVSLSIRRSGGVSGSTLASV